MQKAGSPEAQDKKDKVTILLMVKHKSSLDPKGPAFLVYDTGFRNQARDGFYQMISSKLC